MGIADQLPRDGRGLGDARDNLDSRRRQMRLDERPKPRGVVPPFEDLAKQRLPALGHERFDARGDLRRRVLRKLQIVLEIPADLLAILRRKREFDLAAETLRLKSRDLSVNSYVMPVRPGARLLADAQSRPCRKACPEKFAFQSGSQQLSREPQAHVSTDASTLLPASRASAITPGEVRRCMALQAAGRSVPSAASRDPGQAPDPTSLIGKVVRLLRRRGALAREPHPCSARESPLFSRKNLLFVENTFPVFRTGAAVLDPLRPSSALRRRCDGAPAAPYPFPPRVGGKIRAGTICSPPERRPLTELRSLSPAPRRCARSPSSPACRRIELVARFGHSEGFLSFDAGVVGS